MLRYAVELSNADASKVDQRVLQLLKSKRGGGHAHHVLLEVGEDLFAFKEPVYYMSNPEQAERMATLLVVKLEELGERTFALAKTQGSELTDTMWDLAVEL